jgi:enamine deaminase RidA (YjgF/YER057c/UK114 family)
MAPSRRINVASGRTLESQAHYSRVVRAGDLVLVSGTTAIDRQGNVRGVGDVAKQVDAIMTIAKWGLEKAGSRLEDVVRNRMYVTDVAIAGDAARAVARCFRVVRPAATLVQVSALARPEQLIEIELDAVDGAAKTARRISSGRAIEDEFAYSRAVRVGDRVFISGTTALGAGGVVAGVGDVYRQTRSTMETVFAALAEAGGQPGDLVYGKTFLTDVPSQAADYTRAWVEAMGDVRHASTLLGIPALLSPDMLVEIETDAIIGAAASRRDIYLMEQRERPRGYARAVAVGDVIHVSGCTAISLTGRVEAEGDWAAQTDLANEGIKRALAQAGATLDDVVRRRAFTIASATVNRPYGQGPAIFASARPASTGCRISGLARPELLVEIEAIAVKGAGAGIQSIGPDAVDPLDAATAR